MGAQVKVQIVFLKNDERAVQREEDKGITIVKPDESIKKVVANRAAHGVGDSAGAANCVWPRGS